MYYLKHEAESSHIVIVISAVTVVDYDNELTLNARKRIIKNMKLAYLAFALSLVSVQASADNSTIDAAIGGGIGGAAGAAIGNEVGGRDGAIMGGAVGAAIGTAVNTDEGTHHRSAPVAGSRDEYRSPAAQPSYHCPPGQAKKGRC
jgi:hypothetical protein